MCRKGSCIDGKVPKARMDQEKAHMCQQIACIHRMADKFIGSADLHAAIGRHQPEASQQRQLCRDLQAETEGHCHHAERDRRKRLRIGGRDEQREGSADGGDHPVEKAQRRIPRRPARQNEEGRGRL